MLSESERLDLNLWRVPKDNDYPEGLKYSINYRVLRSDEWVEQIRIDNKERQGHHLHLLDKIEPYNFVSFEKAVKDVEKLIQKLKGG